jgi:hypothetical protein
MMTRPVALPGLPMQQTVSMLVQQAITTAVFDSTSQQPAVSASLTLGACTQVTARSPSYQKMTKLFKWSATFLKSLEAPYLQQPVPKLSTWPQSHNSPLSCHRYPMPHPWSVQLRGWGLPHLQGWQLLHLKGGHHIEHHHRTKHCPPDATHTSKCDTQQ